jgi:uncharacterized OsmC-like protein
VVELIWDSGTTGTATAPAGASITIGDAADFSPEDLVAAAAAGCLMRTFLELAGDAHVPILSYGSASHVERSDPRQAFPVLIRCFVVASAAVSESEIRRLLRDAVSASPVCRMLGSRVICQPDVRSLHDVCPS